MKAKAAVFLIILSLLFLFVSCTSTNGASTDSWYKDNFEPDYNPDGGFNMFFYEIVPKEKLLVYVRSSVIGIQNARFIKSLLFANGIDCEIINDESEIPSLERQYYMGSCFSIAPHYAITNAHVLGYGWYTDYNQENYIIINGRQYVAEIIHIDSVEDLALIHIPDYTFPYSFRVQTADQYQVASRIYAIGYPIADLLGQDARVTDGIINSKTGFNGDDDAIQISTPIQPGNSGGPVVLADDYSQVIGIASSTLSDLAMLERTGNVAQNVNFAIKSKLLSQFDKYIPDAEKESIKTPNNINEAIDATAFVYCTFKPETQYERRIMPVFKTEKKTTVHYVGSYSYNTYVTDLTLTFKDVDSMESYSLSFQTSKGEESIVIQNSIREWIIDSYGPENFKNI